MPRWEWESLLAFVAGGGFAKAAEVGLRYWRGRQQDSVEARRLGLEAELSQEAAAAELRDELRAEVRRLAVEQAGLREEMEKLRAAYWRVVEEREILRGELTAVRARNAALEARVGELEERCGKCPVLTQFNPATGEDA